jgi:peptidyl-prolyl cis-trans isomerase C
MSACRFGGIFEMKRLFRSPALHFLVIGAFLFVVRSAAVGTPQRVEGLVDRSPVVVTPADIADLRAQYQKDSAGEPDAAAYEYMIDRFVNDELLYREALALGLDRGDSSVRYRLVEKMEYLGESEEGDDAGEVVDRAIALGLSRSDPLVRSGLIQKYSMLVRFSGFEPPEEKQLRAYYEENKQRYVRPARVSLVHVFFSKQDRGREQARSDAAQAIGTLRSQDVSPAAAIADGDVFLMGHRFENQSDRTLSQLFGADFAREVFDEGELGWVGPFDSAFGSHVVFIEAATPAGILDFEAVRNQVSKAVDDQIREGQLANKLVELRRIYEVEIQWGEFKPEDGE